MQQMLCCDEQVEQQPTNPADAFEAASTVEQYQAQMGQPLWQVTDNNGTVIEGADWAARVGVRSVHAFPRLLLFDNVDPRPLSLPCPMQLRRSPLGSSHLHGWRRSFLGACVMELLTSSYVS